jgi:sec-independent protein translocase protein TatA
MRFRFKFYKNNQKYMLNFGTKEIIIIAAVLVLLFGAKKVPELARGVGDAIRHIRNGFKDEDGTESKKGSK